MRCILDPGSCVSRWFEFILFLSFLQAARAPGPGPGEFLDTGDAPGTIVLAEVHGKPARVTEDDFFKNDHNPLTKDEKWWTSKFDEVNHGAGAKKVKGYKPDFQCIFDCMGKFKAEYATDDQRQMTLVLTMIPNKDECRANYCPDPIKLKCDEPIWTQKNTCKTVESDDKNNHVDGWSIDLQSDRTDREPWHGKTIVEMQVVHTSKKTEGTDGVFEKLQDVSHILEKVTLKKKFQYNVYGPKEHDKCFFCFDPDKWGQQQAFDPFRDKIEIVPGLGVETHGPNGVPGFCYNTFEHDRHVRAQDKIEQQVNRRDGVKGMEVMRVCQNEDPEDQRTCTVLVTEMAKHVQKLFSTKSCTTFCEQYVGWQCARAWKVVMDHVAFMQQYEESMICPRPETASEVELTSCHFHHSDHTDMLCECSLPADNSDEEMEVVKQDERVYVEDFQQWTCSRQMVSPTVCSDVFCCSCPADMELVVVSEVWNPELSSEWTRSNLRNLLACACSSDPSRPTIVGDGEKPCECLPNEAYPGLGEFEVAEPKKVKKEDGYICEVPQDNNGPWKLYAEGGTQGENWLNSKRFGKGPNGEWARANDVWVERGPVVKAQRKDDDTVKYIKGGKGEPAIEFGRKGKKKATKPAKGKEKSEVQKSDKKSSKASLEEVEAGSDVQGVAWSPEGDENKTDSKSSGHRLSSVVALASLSLPLSAAVVSAAL